MTSRPARRRRRAQQAGARSAMADLAAALNSTDAAGVLSALHPDARVVIDDGGREGASVSVPGRSSTVRMLLDLMTGATARPASINGSPGVVVIVDARVVAAICGLVRGTAFTQLWVVTGPEKLRRWNPV